MSNLYYNYATFKLKKATSRAVPQKSVPHHFGLDILRKFFRAWRFEQFEEHIFYNSLISIICSEKLYFEMDKLACICLINCYLQDMIRNLVKFNISIFAKGVPFSC